MKYLYGSIPDSQVKEIQKSIRGSIFFLLLCVDPKTAESGIRMFGLCNARSSQKTNIGCWNGNS